MRTGIRGKMLLGIMIPVVIVLVSAGIIISQIVGSHITTLTVSQLSSASLAAANDVSGYFNGFLKLVQQAALEKQAVDYLDALKPGTPANKGDGYADIEKSMIARARADSESILAAWLGDIDSSQLFQSDGFLSAPGWDITARPWYQVSNTKAPMMTQPYVDASTGSIIVTAAAPIFSPSGNAVNGVAGLDITLNTVQNNINSKKIGETGYLILMSTEGEILCHPNADYVQKRINDTDFSDNIKQAVSSGTLGDFTYKIGNAPFYGSLSRVESAGWYVLSALPEAEALSGYRTVLGTISSIFFFGLIILALSVLLISSGITRPLKKLAHAAHLIADGELDVSIGVHTKDETGQVALAMERTVATLKNYIDYIGEITGVLNKIAGGVLVFELQYDYSGGFESIRDALMNIRSTLTNTIQQISQTAEQVTMGSSHVADSAQGLAQGSTEQASAVEELSATISDITRNVEESARRTDGANRQASIVGEQLTQSNTQMKNLVEAVGEISVKSGEIGKIIKTIEDIAFQTNILALNAAVEAARAGTAGKGFAVVADEVRNLATKSGEAAKNTTALIEESLHAIERGAGIANEAAVSLESVVTDAKEIVSAVEAIAKASEEQAHALGEVRTGIEQIASVVQTNSATAEESAAAGEELSGEASRLFDLVSRFRLQETERNAHLLN